MRTLDSPILFYAEVRHRLRGFYHRGLLQGRLSPAAAPSCRCPEAADTTIPAPGLPDALRDAVLGWVGEGSAPPLAVTIQHHRSHPPGGEAPLFTGALAAVLRAACSATMPEQVAWVRVRLLPVSGELPPEIQALTSAGHLLQAAELLRAMRADEPPEAQRQALERFLAEVFFGESPDRIAAVVWDLAPRAADALLRDAAGGTVAPLIEAVSAVKRPQRLVVLAELQDARQALGEPALTLRTSQQMMRAVYSAGYLLNNQGALHQQVTDQLQRAIINGWMGEERG